MAPDGGGHPIRCTLIVVIAVLAGCSSAPATLSNTQWKLLALSGTAVPMSSRATLEFGTDDTVSGNGGCNRYGGRVKLRAATINFGALVATRMACADSGAMQQESRLFAALAAARSFRREGSQLVLLEASGAPVANFSRR